MVEQAQKPLGFHVYGSSGALKFELVDSESNAPVLSVDACLKVGDSYDWGNKVILQLSDREVPELMCCVLGLTVEFEARNHGVGKNKSVRLVNQVQYRRIYVQVSRPEYSVRVPMTPDAVFKLGALGLQALSAQTGFDGPTCLAILRGTAGRLYSVPPSPSR